MSPVDTLSKQRTHSHTPLTQLKKKTYQYHGLIVCHIRQSNKSTVRGAAEGGGRGGFGSVFVFKCEVDVRFNMGALQHKQTLKLSREPRTCTHNEYKLTHTGLPFHLCPCVCVCVTQVSSACARGFECPGALCFAMRCESRMAWPLGGTRATFCSCVKWLCDSTTVEWLLQCEICQGIPKSDLVYDRKDTIIGKNVGNRLQLIVIVNKSFILLKYQGVTITTQNIFFSLFGFKLTYNSTKIKHNNIFNRLHFD